jgi:hypothetical protein
MIRGAVFVAMTGFGLTIANAAGAAITAGSGYSVSASIDAFEGYREEKSVNGATSAEVESAAGNFPRDRFAYSSRGLGRGI